MKTKFRGTAIRVSFALLLSLLLASPFRCDASDDPLFATSSFPSGFQISREAREIVPTPLEVLGYKIGERMSDPAEIVRYLHTVAAASPRVKVSSYGTTPEGRELVVATTSSLPSSVVP